jgi:hypothetical protein
VSSKRNVAREYLVYTILLLLGCLTTLVGVFLPANGQTVALSIGTSVIAASIISFTMRYLLGDPFSGVSDEITSVTRALNANLKEAVTVLASASKTGLLSISVHRSAVQTEFFVEQIRASRQNIDLLAYAMAFLPEHPATVPILKERALAGCRIRILLGDPNGACIKARSIEEKFEGSIQSRIEATLARLEQLKGLTNVEIRFHDTPLYSSIYRFDGRMIVTPQLYGVRAAAAPLLYLARVEDGLFDRYLSNFDAVWSISSSFPTTTITSLKKVPPRKPH